MRSEEIKIGLIIDADEFDAFYRIKLSNGWDYNIAKHIAIKLYDV